MIYKKSYVLSTDIINQTLSLELKVLPQTPEPPATEVVIKAVEQTVCEKIERVSLSWRERLRKETEEKIAQDLERSRARSALMNTIAKNDLQRRKMNELKHGQAKSNREKERRRQKTTSKQ